MEILVFKTSVESEKDAELIVNELTTIPGLQKVNFDLEDCDRILRVEVRNSSPFAIENLLLSKGFVCVELY
jgi:hypothetical protein